MIKKIDGTSQPIADSAWMELPRAQFNLTFVFIEKGNKIDGITYRSIKAIDLDHSLPYKELATKLELVQRQLAKGGRYGVIDHSKRQICFDHQFERKLAKVNQLTLSGLLLQMPGATADINQWKLVELEEAEFKLHLLLLLGEAEQLLQNSASDQKGEKKAGKPSQQRQVSRATTQVEKTQKLGKLATFAEKAAKLKATLSEQIVEQERRFVEQKKKKDALAKKKQQVIEEREISKQEARSTIVKEEVLKKEKSKGRL